MYGRAKPTLAGVKRELIGDSIDRKRLVERLIQLVREDERNRVLSVTEKARQQGER